MRDAGIATHCNWMRPLRFAALAVAILATTWLMLPADAAEITASENGSILITGRIQSGDETSFQSLLSNRSGRGPTEVISTHRVDCFWQQ